MSAPTALTLVCSCSPLPSHSSPPPANLRSPYLVFRAAFAAPVRHRPGRGAAPGAAARRARRAPGWPARPRSTSTHRAAAGLRLARHSGWATAGQVPLGLRRVALLFGLSAQLPILCRRAPAAGYPTGARQADSSLCETGGAAMAQLLRGGLDEETAFKDFDVDCDADIILGYDWLCAHDLNVLYE